MTLAETLQGGTPTGTQTLAQKLSTPTALQTQSLADSIWHGLAGVGVGAAKAVVRPLERIGGAVETGLDQTLGRGINAATGHGFTPTTTGAQALATANSDALKPHGVAQQVGDVAGTVAPYLMGEGEAGLLSRILVNTAKGTAQTGSLTQGVETGLGGEALGVLGKAAKGVSSALYKTFSVPTSKAEARLVQAYQANTPFLTRIATAITGNSKAPVTAAETAFQHGLMGTESMIGVQAKKATSGLWNGIIAPALKGVEAKVSMPKFFDEAQQQLVAANPELSRQKSLLTALDALKEDYKGVDSVSLEQLQKFKEGWAKFIPDKAYRGEPIAGAFQEVKKLAAGLARTAIYQGVNDPAVKRAYLDYGNLKGLQEWGQTAMTGAKFKGGAGSFISGMAHELITPVTTVGGQVLYKTGQGIEFFGPAGAKYLSDLFSGQSLHNEQPPETQ